MDAVRKPARRADGTLACILFGCRRPFIDSQLAGAARRTGIPIRASVQQPFSSAILADHSVSKPASSIALRRLSTLTCSGSNDTVAWP